jgi:hypothetical protein
MADDAPAILDDLHAPVMFADDALSYSLLDGTVRITFSCLKFTQPEGVPVRVVSGRLVMGIDAAQRMVVGLNDFMESRGLGPSASMKGAESVQ